MPLPFLDQTKEATVSAKPEVITRKSDNEDEEEYDGLSGAMEELHSALQSKNYKEAAEIFRSCFELMDSQPHVEGPHLKETK